MPAFALIAGAHPETNKKAAFLFGIFHTMTAMQTLDIYRPRAHVMEHPLRRRVAIVAIPGARDFNACVEPHRQQRIAMQVEALMRAAH